MATKINMCPYCGRNPKIKRVIVLRWIFSGKFYRVECRQCGMSSSYGRIKDDAIRVWNNLKLELF